MSKVLGQAILVTKENAPQLTIVNFGVEPPVEEENPSYFIMTNNPDDTIHLLPTYAFHENFKFVWTETTEYMNDFVAN